MQEQGSRVGYIAVYIYIQYTVHAYVHIHIQHVPTSGDVQDNEWTFGLRLSDCDGIHVISFRRANIEQTSIWRTIGQVVIQ